MRIKPALLLASCLSMAPMPVQAIPVLFGSANTAGGAPITDVAPGQSVTVTGPMLQLRLADGSTVIAPQGASFTVSSDSPVSITLLSGSLRVSSAGSPITVTRGGVSITSDGGVFSAFAQGQGLSGRVNHGSAQVAVGGQTRTFSNGGGYVAGAGGISGTFTPPATTAPALARQAAQSSTPGPDFSAADPRSSSGSGAVAVSAAQAQGFPIGNNGVPTGNSGNNSTGNSGNNSGSNTGNGNGVGTGDTGNTGGNNAGNNTGTNTGNSTGNSNTGNSGGTTPSYGGTPAVTGTVALTGTDAAGQQITYAGDIIGIDTRYNTIVTRGAAGELNGYNASSDEHVERNTNQSLDRATAGGISVERWSGGVTGGKYYQTPDMARTSNQGLHFAYGLPTVAVPSQGLATYVLGAATKPTFGDGYTDPGAFAGTMGILFTPGIPKVGVDYTVTMPTDGSYNIKTAGGATAPSFALASGALADKRFYMYDIPVTGAGAACVGGNCKASVYGTLSGANAESVGISYIFGAQSLPVDSLGRSRTITGAAAFTQDAFDASQGSIITHPAVSSGAVTAAFRSSTSYGGFFYVAPPQAGITLLDASRTTVNAQGVVDTFVSNNMLYSRNDNSVAELYGTRYVQIGRWNGGTVQKAGSSYYTADGWQGMPYVVGIPALAGTLPTTGIATYVLKGATAPILTTGDGQPGTFTGSMGVDFSTINAGGAKVGITGQATINTSSAAVTYDIGTPGGAVAPAGSSVTASNVGGITGSYNVVAPGGDVVCGGSTCQVVIRGVIGGPGGRDAGLGYQIGTGQTQVVGAAAFERTDDATLAHKELDMRGFLVAPGTLVLANSYGVQSLTNNSQVTYTSDGQGVQAIKDARNFEAVTAQVLDKGTAGGLTWSRWSDGTVSDAFGAVPALGANQGMHQIVGDPATNLPTSGTAQYTLAGYTKPTSTDNVVTPGTFSGAMAVQFGSTSANTGVGLDLHVTIGGHTYDIATTGGVANPGSSQYKLNGGSFGGSSISVTPGGPACTGGTCNANVQGFLSGHGGTSAGIGYTISQFGSPNNPGAVQGTAAFVKAP